MSIPLIAPSWAADTIQRNALERREFLNESQFPAWNRLDTFALSGGQLILLYARNAGVLSYTFTLRGLALFAILRSGTGKDIIMTATRPPGGSVFLVEDEVMIRMMVADMLEELGYTVAAEAGEINEAIRLAQSTEFDLAILDVNVNGKVISPVAELIRARNRPFIFATGYGSSGLPEEYRDRPALQKPFQLETLARLIDSTLKSATV